MFAGRIALSCNERSKTWQLFTLLIASDCLVLGSWLDNNRPGALVVICCGARGISRAMADLLSTGNYNGGHRDQFVCGLCCRDVQGKLHSFHAHLQWLTAACCVILWE